MAPRLGFIGLGWIGALRLQAVAGARRAEVAALCDADAERLTHVAARYPSAEAFDDDAVLLDRAPALGLDGVVIATPNALHAPQTLRALDGGLAVFCQKPLGLDAEEARAMILAARRADRLLGVDYSYRHTDGARALRRMIGAGELGRVFSVDSVFHNAYGPDKAWCYDAELAGGGALMDLGVHQIDLPLWLLGQPDVGRVRGRVFRDGDPLGDGPGIDDFAAAQLELAGGAVLTMTVSWNAHAGADCVYRVAAFGTDGGAELRNIDGSFYEFELERFDGRTGRIVGRESRAWLGRAIGEWIDRLARDPGFDPAVEHSVPVSMVVDALYGRSDVVPAGGPGAGPADRARSRS